MVFRRFYSAPSFPALGFRGRALAVFIISQYSICPSNTPPVMVIILDSCAWMGCFVFQIKDYEIRNGTVSLDNQLLGESLSQRRKKVTVELAGKGAAIQVPSNLGGHQFLKVRGFS